MDFLVLNELLRPQDIREEVLTIASDSARDEMTAPTNALNNVEGAGEGKDPLRLKSLRVDNIFKEARSYATKMGLYWQTKKINEMVSTRYGDLLSQINFTPFLEQGMILVPSITMTDESESLSDGTLTRVNVSFRVDEEAEIVSVPPTYRDALIYNNVMPEKLHSALNPKNNEEMALWNKGVRAGWSIGVTQAELAFSDRLAEFERDVIGRTTYLKMKSLGMIAPVTLDVKTHGLTFNGRTMNVGEVVYRITDPASYQSIDKWRTAWKATSPNLSSSEGKK